MGSRHPADLADAGHYVREQHEDEVSTAQFIAAAQRYYREREGLVVSQSGYDQYDGQRKGGWIPARGSSAPNATTRPAKLPKVVLEKSLNRLVRKEEELAAANLEDMCRRLGLTPNLQNRDIPVYEEEEVTAVEFQRAVADIRGDIRGVRDDLRYMRDEFLTSSDSECGVIVEAESITTKACEEAA